MNDFKAILVNGLAVVILGLLAFAGIVGILGFVIERGWVTDQPAVTVTTTECHDQDS